MHNFLHYWGCPTGITSTGKKKKVKSEIGSVECGMNINCLNSTDNYISDPEGTQQIKKKAPGLNSMPFEQTPVHKARTVTLINVTEFHFVYRHIVERCIVLCQKVAHNSLDRQENQ